MKTETLVAPPVWTYSPYRATLKRGGKTFAIVTPDGTNALNKADQKTLLDALNLSCTSVIKISWSPKKRGSG